MVSEVNKRVMGREGNGIGRCIRGGVATTQLLYADDTVLVADSEKKLRHLVK